MIYNYFTPLQRFENRAQDVYAGGTVRPGYIRFWKWADNDTKPRGMWLSNGDTR
jgi:hypothetical protein